MIDQRRSQNKLRTVVTVQTSLINIHYMSNINPQAVKITDSIEQNQGYISPVQVLRQAGNKVKVIHYRASREKALNGHMKLIPSWNVTNDQFYPKGGLTQVSIQTPEGHEATGEVKCSHHDPYNRRLGVKIAVGRAIKALQKYHKCVPQEVINAVLSGNLPTPIKITT